MAIKFQSKAKPEQKQAEEIEKRDFSLNVALQKKEAGESHSQIAKHFGLTEPELSKNVNQAGLTLAWDEIGKRNPDFIFDDYSTSITSRKKLAAKYGFNSQNAFSKMITKTKQAKSKPPLSTSIATIRIGNRKVPIEQHEYFTLDNPLKRMSQEQVDALVGSILEMSRKRKTTSQIAAELGISRNSYFKRVNELGISEHIKAARNQCPGKSKEKPVFSSEKRKR